MLLQMQGRPRAFEGTGDKRVFDQEDYSYNIDPFEVPQKLTQRPLRMSSSADKDNHDDVKLSSVIEPHENDVLLGRGGKRTATTDGSAVSRGLPACYEKGEVTII
jgi:hypothetical protein